MKILEVLGELSFIRDYGLDRDRLEASFSNFLECVGSLSGKLEIYGNGLREVIAIGPQEKLRKVIDFESSGIKVVIWVFPKPRKHKEYFYVFSYHLVTLFKFYEDKRVRDFVAGLISFTVNRLAATEEDFYKSLVDCILNLTDASVVKLSLYDDAGKKTYISEKEVNGGSVLSVSRTLLNFKLEIEGLKFVSASLELAMDSVLLFMNLFDIKRRLEEKLRYFSFFYLIGNLFRRTGDFRRRVETALWALCCERGAFKFDESAYFLYDEAEDLFKGFLYFSSVSCVEAAASIPASDLFGVISDIKVHVDVSGDDIIPLFPGIQKAINLKSSYSYFVPLFVNENVIGAFVVGSRVELTPFVTEMLKHFADECSLAFESARIQDLYKATIDELRGAKESLEEAERLKGLGEFVARIVHDIKNPIVAIAGIADKLYRKFPEDYPEKKIIKMIVDESNKLLDVLNDVLGYVRKPYMRKTEVDVNEILDEILFMEVQEIREKNITLIKQLDRTMPKISGDRAQLKRAFMNLVKNSIQAMEKLGGGILKVSTSCELTGGKSFVKVEISDTGGGISPDIVSNIFNPFFTTKSEGTGLGLSTAKKVIELHGGIIKLVNDYPRGATFEVYLPFEVEKCRKIQNF